jgi:hypothetical protein
MNTQLESFLALHRPEAKDLPMVYEVWQDGEVTITKGGGLFGARNLHLVSPGLGRDIVDPLALPNRHGVNGSIMVNDRASAKEALIVLTGEVSPWL